MYSAAFDLGESLNNHNVNYYLYKPLWDRFNFPGENINFSEWVKIKYLNEEGDNFNPLINTIPDTTGGLYLFYIPCNIISGLTDFPFYIGRAQLTDHQNLQKRVKEYFQKYSRNNERPKITRMFKYWGHLLHLAYYSLNGNADIIELERQLVNFLLLPMNDQIPDTEIKQAIKAF